MPLNSYQRMCYKKFGDIAESMVSDKLKLDLEKAHIEMRPGAYLSCVWVNTVLASVVSLFVAITLIIFLRPEITLSILLIVFSIILTVGVYFGGLLMPASKAKARSKKIDMNLPYALNFISAMSSAGITPTEIFKSLSKQDIYGEIKEESLAIYRDVSLLGRDIISALKANIQRTPSNKFKEFLQGAVVTVQSGGALKPYFMAKADQYTRENRIAQRQLIESLGIMAEAYVTAAVAGVLLMIIIIPILMIMPSSGSTPEDLIAFGWIICPMIIMIHAGFAFVLSSMSAKV